MINLSLYYASVYEKEPKQFLGAFIRNKSIRTACVFIVSTYKQIGFESEKDFTDWANKQRVPEKSKRTLAEIVKIIYEIIKK